MRSENRKVQWLMPIIPASWEEEVGGSQIEASLGKKHKTLSEK
jgi:hypothetical protein